MKKPTLTGSRKYKQGIFQLKNPKKYIGDPNSVFYRSNLEKRYMKLFDEQDSIVSWGSEEITIEYQSKIDVVPKIRRYFPDFIIKVRCRDKVERVFIIEIKPKSQLLPPKNKRKKSYIDEMLTWQQNHDKWDHASQFCLKNGCIFRILTEEHLLHGF